MAQLKATNISGSLVVTGSLHKTFITPSGFIGIGSTNDPAYPIQVSQSIAGWQLNVTNTTSIQSFYLNNGTGYGMFLDCGSSAGAGTYAMKVEKLGSVYLQLRGDGYVGVGAAPSTNGWIQVTSVNTSTAHFSLTNGITNANASGFYTFRGWWGVYFNSPVFNAGTSGLYYIPIYS